MGIEQTLQKEIEESKRWDISCDPYLRILH